MRHNFATSLAVSKQTEDEPWWHEIYSRAFPGYLSAVSVREDGWAQRGGIDRVVTLKSGKTLTIDEKVRQQAWGDIALERWSDRVRKKPGWMQKDLACDFIAYAFVPIQTGYLFPFLMLRRAWLSHGREWCELASNQEAGFRVVLADNGNYVTESIAVPTATLLSAVREAMTVSWAGAS
jgi:hypothetical protein